MTKPLPFDPIAEAERQWRARGWAAPDAMAAATSIMRAQQIVLARVDEALKPHGLTFARYEALVLLTFSRRGSLPLGKMGERLMVHPTSVTNIIDRLEQQGLVRRVPHETDRRTTLAELTPAGRNVVEAATEAITKVHLGMEGLSRKQLRQLTGLLAVLRLNADDFTGRSGGRVGLAQAVKDPEEGRAKGAR
jgi:DNA-binding MarR family transcriptional regulator